MPIKIELIKLFTCVSLFTRDRKVKFIRLTQIGPAKMRHNNLVTRRREPWERSWRHRWFYPIVKANWKLDYEQVGHILKIGVLHNISPEFSLCLMISQPHLLLFKLRNSFNFHSKKVNLRIESNFKTWISSSLMIIEVILLSYFTIDIAFNTRSFKSQGLV